MRRLGLRLGMEGCGAVDQNAGNTELGVRDAACRALIALDAAKATEPLIGALADKNKHTREWACEALAKIGDGGVWRR